MIRAWVCVAFVAAAAATSGCSGGTKQPAGTIPSVTTVPTSVATSVPVAEARVVVRGNATLNGAPFDAKFLGAIVRRSGLVTPCQSTLPQVNRGRYEIEVLSDVEASGCGGPGAEILLWVFANDKEYFSTRAIAWPGNARATTFDASFTTAAPDGAARRRTEFAGEVFERDGRQLPQGTRVEAYTGNTLCGVASVRRSGDFLGFSLSVVGPESVAGCMAGATVTFRVNGRRAVTTAVNDFRGLPSLDLTLP